MQRFARSVSVISTVFFGAIFGFFYAWICSTMWAFDTLDARLAIEVMQVVNENVRNLVFFPVFMLTPVIGAVAAVALFVAGQKTAAAWFVAASLVYLGGGLFLTMFANVPLNHDLAGVTIPSNQDEATAIWEAFSPQWQMWNVTRTVLSGIALALAAVGLIAIRKA